MYNYGFFFLNSFQKYKDLDGEVIRKDGIILLRELASEVKNFMDFKMNAVMVCVLHHRFYSIILKFVSFILITRRE